MQNFGEATTLAKDLFELFGQTNQRQWTIETMMVELQAEVGTLSDSVMIEEGYRPIRDGDELDLADDLADVLFLVLLVADHYKIDLDRAYRTMIGLTRAKLLARQAP